MPAGRLKLPNLSNEVGFHKCDEAIRLVVWFFLKCQDSTFQKFAYFWMKQTRRHERTSNPEQHFSKPWGECVICGFFMANISIRSLYSQHCQVKKRTPPRVNITFLHLADKFGIFHNCNVIKTLGFSFEVCENEESIREHTPIYPCVPGEAQSFAPL